MLLSKKLRTFYLSLLTYNFYNVQAALISPNPLDHANDSSYQLRFLQSTHPRAPGKINLDFRSLIQPHSSAESFGHFLPQIAFGLSLGLFDTLLQWTQTNSQNTVLGAGIQFTLFHSKGPSLSLRGGYSAESNQNWSSSLLSQSQNYEIVSSIKFHFLEPYFSYGQLFRQNSPQETLFEHQSHYYTLGFLIPLGFFHMGSQIQFSEYNLNGVLQFSLNL